MNSHQDADAATGASMVEYALLLTLITMTAILALTLMGQDISSTFSEVTSSL